MAWRSNRALIASVWTLLAVVSSAQEPTFDPADVRLALTDVVPEQVIYITRENGAFAAYLTRTAEGKLVLEWARALEGAWFYSDRDLILVTKIPPGDYVVRSWTGQSRSVGKTYLRGLAMETSIAVAEEMVEASLHIEDESAPGQLTLYWSPVATEQGVAVYVDDRLAGVAFDCAELHLKGLVPGERLVRIESPSFEPLSQTLSVAEYERPLFVRRSPFP